MSTIELQLKFVRVDGWPPLAWLAELSRSSPVVRVLCGHRVETRDSWACEAVWDGPFEDGGFDRTDLVFGSGIRVRRGGVEFVSSRASLDRLQFAQLGEQTWVSNSLACLLAVSGLKFDITYDGFPGFFKSIMRGINSYERRLPVEEGNLELCYVRNLLWDGRQLAENDKPSPTRDFSSFSRYRSFLSTSLEQLAENMSAAERSHRYSMVSSLSSGYDSTMVAALGMEAGMQRAFSFTTARGWVPDHGQEAARALGLELSMINRLGWRRTALAEVPYLASTGMGPDVILSGAQELLRGNVLLSGFQGDKVWGKDTTDFSSDIIRSDASAVSFSEHRLELGCIHVPVPFIGIGQMRDIVRISNDPELDPWDVAGDYSRPICRRIAEEAGVPRECFGIEKRATTNLFHRGEVLLTPQTRAEYHGWLRKNAMRWVAAGRNAPRVPSRLEIAIAEVYAKVSTLLERMAQYAPERAKAWIVGKDKAIKQRLGPRINLVDYLFAWAMERLIESRRASIREEKLGTSQVDPARPGNPT